jgi:hypothetical protein
MSSDLDRLVQPFGFKSYGHYLQSEQWKNFSRWTKKGRCQCCGTKTRLQLHHKTYANICRELPDDVVTLCDICHEQTHELRKQGFPLATAHAELRKEKPICNNPQARWVHWKGLVNRALRQTVTDLQAFLTQKGLLDKERLATAKAIDLGFAKIEADGRERWHLQRYTTLMQADKQAKKLLAKGRSIHPAIKRRALLD